MAQQYAKALRRKYDSGALTKEEFLRRVLNYAIREARGKGWVEKGTRALVELSQTRGRGEFVPVRDILRRMGRDYIASGGVDPWHEESAGVVEKTHKPLAVRIKDEFYDAMLNLFECAEDPEQSAYNGILAQIRFLDAAHQVRLLCDLAALVGGALALEYTQAMPGPSPHSATSRVS